MPWFTIENKAVSRDEMLCLVERSAAEALRVFPCQGGFGFLLCRQALLRQGVQNFNLAWVAEWQTHRT